VKIFKINLRKHIYSAEKTKLEDYPLLVTVPPIYSKLNGPALVIFLYGPIVVQWNESSCEKIIVMWFYK